MRSGTASACGTTCSATGRAPEWREDRVIADHTTSRALLALQGRRADAWRTHVAGTTGFFAVTIERVCEPVVWTIFRGSGLWGPIQLELFCSD
jgi:hypothetical protein